MLECRGMAVQALYALQNGFLGFERSGLFFGEFSGERVQIPIACWLIRAPDAILLFDTGLSPRAVPGLMRNDPMARFTTSDLPANLLVELPETGPVILAADSCYWQEHIDKERVPGVVWNPTQALHSIKRLKTIARLTGARIFPGHDPNFWETVRQSPDAYR